MEICVAIGALCSMTGGVINCAFCLARAIYVMGRDGLLPATFAKTNEFSHTPVNATIFGAVLSIIISVFVSFVALIEFLSLVAFVEFVIVAMACLMLRYSPPAVERGYQRLDGDDEDDDDDGDADDEEEDDEINQKVVTTELKGGENRGFEDSYDARDDEKAPLLTSPPISPEKSGLSSSSRKIIKSDHALKRWADDHPTTVTFFSLVTAVLSTFVVLIILTYKTDEITGGNGFAIFLLVACILLALVSCAPFWILKQYPEGIPFKVIVQILFQIIIYIIQCYHFDNDLC